MRATVPAHGIDEAGCGIDLSGGADRHEQVAVLKQLRDLIKPVRIFAEPDNMRTRGSDIAATAANRFGTGFILAPDVAAVAAAKLCQLAMHVDEVVAAGALMKIINVLGDDPDLAVMHLFQARECFVRIVGRGVARRAAALIVEVMNTCGVAAEGGRGGHVFDGISGPDAVSVPKRAQS